MKKTIELPIAWVEGLIKQVQSIKNNSYGGDIVSALSILLAYIESLEYLIEKE